jgi:hypothetical protein
VVLVWLWGWYKLWLRYLLNVDVPRAHYVKSLAYRVFLSKPNAVLTILSGVCPICGRRFKHNLDAYYHFTKYTRCSGSLFEIFNTCVRCDFVNVDLVHMMFPFNVIDVYRSYARRVVCSDGVDGRRVYISVFDFDRCSLKSHDVAYFIDCGDWKVMRVVGDGDS